MAMTTQEALSKVRKLLRMTEDRGCTEAEAKQAAMMAQRIMLAHRIESIEAEAEGAAPAPDQPVEAWADPLDQQKQKTAWRGRLALEICRACGCAVFWSGAALRIVGTADNATAARYLYAFCSREIDRMAKQHAGNGRVWINNWRIGAAQGVGESLREANEAARREAAPGTALVLVDSALALIRRDRDRADNHMRYTMGIRGKVRHGGSYDSGAREAGKRDGRSINVNSKGRPAVGGGNLRLKGGA